VNSHLKPIFTLTLLACLVVVGCATKQLERPKSTDELTSELPPELQKFKVETELRKAEPVVVPATTPKVSGDELLVGKGKKASKKRRGKEKAVEVAPVPAAQPSPGLGFQIQNRRPQNGHEPFPIGEKMTWNVGYLAFSAGTATSTVMPYNYINGRKVYHLEGTAKSSGIMNLFYSLDDVVETFIDFEGMFTHRFHMVLDETKQKRDSVEIHDLEKMDVFWWSRLNHAEKGFIEKKETSPIPPYAQDIYSALYYLRTVPLPDGANIKLPLIVEGKAVDAEVNVLRREECGTVVGKRTCVVVKPETRLQGVLQKTTDSFIWLTDDEQRLVVRIEANVKIGSISVTLEKYESGQPQ